MTNGMIDFPDGSHGIVRNGMVEMVCGPVPLGAVKGPYNFRAGSLAYPDGTPIYGCGTTTELRALLSKAPTVEKWFSVLRPTGQIKEWGLQHTPNGRGWLVVGFYLKEDGAFVQIPGGPLPLEAVTPLLGGYAVTRLAPGVVPHRTGTRRDWLGCLVMGTQEVCLPARQQLTSHGLAQWLLSQPDVPVSRNGEDGVEAERDEEGIFLY